MSSTGNLTVTGNVTGAPTGSRTFGPLTITATSAVDATQVLALSTGANTVTVPSGATACVILGPNAVSPTPNPRSGVTLTLKGVTGDTGVAVSNQFPTLLAWDSAPSTFVITASGSTTVEIFFI